MANESRGSSPWPLVAALGIVATEAGVLFGLVPIAVGGVLAFGSSCAGMIAEVGYASEPWRPLRLVGAGIAAVSAAVWIAVAPAVTPSGLAAGVATDGIAVRAAIVFVSAALLIAAGAVGPVVTGGGLER
ncbi:DUF7541 family protein [Natronococcus jeotgali]|uniref:Cox cluster protein n=1 Tax=Natronococcus jeotgali DSM 18795 TaxID=1227498 RepID=L9X4Q2_9EURY|nr:hypothetical protein [Natronococcus jeotgali]ELY56587.1 cox cluster protein [Natronococcus jeotgali DSM 18795]